jgi:hypothetical protein
VHVCERRRRENSFPRAIRDLRRALAGLHWKALLAGVLAMVAPLAAFAQGSAVTPRVTDRVDIARLATLTGNTHPLARAQYDQGAAPPDLPMNRIMLVLKRSPDQEAALQDLLAQQQVTSSASFHKWLTPDQFGQQFGPADADIQAVTSWLASYGFQSIKVSKGRTVIEFSGTASQVQTALHTTIHRYVVNGEAHWANANDPQVPVALAPVVSGFVSLHNFHKKPASVRSGRTAVLTRASNGKPQINLCTVNQSPCPAANISHGLAPADFEKIYNIGSSATGSGVTIGVVARSNITLNNGVPQDIADFRSTFGLPNNNPNIILNGPDPGDLGGNEEAEAVLDATWPGAIAPAATVDLVVSEDTNAAPGEDLSEFYIIDNNLADIMTESFSVCEADFGSSLFGSTGFASFYSSLAEEAAAQGITYLVASGDGGPDSCDDAGTVPTADQPASVNLLASTPFTVAVGGTQFNDIANPSTYWQASNGADDESAKSYIPEDVWNESCTALGATCPAIGLWSSGGGESIVFQQPPWQTGVTGIPAGASNGRFVPDVSLTAADHDGYVLCLDASCESNPASFSILSGTSASAQAFGGIMALVVQKNGRQGQADYVLYKLAANNETYANCNGSAVPSPATLTGCIFNDVTSGNTDIPGETGFLAVTGYDRATGLGSVNVTNLLANWSKAVVSGSTTTLVVNNGTSPLVFAYGAPVPVTVTVNPVAPATGAPTGDVSLIAQNIPGAANPNLGVDCNILPNTPPAQGGSGCFNVTFGNSNFSNNTVSWSTAFLPGGTYPLIAHYPGDGTFLGSDSAPVTVTINKAVSVTRLGFVTNGASCTTATTVPYGSGYVLTVAVIDKGSILSQNGPGTVCQPTPTGALPTGTVTIADGTSPLPSVDGGSTFKLNSFGFFEDQQIQNLSVGTHNIQAAYAGDNSFDPSSSNVTVLNVTKASTTAAITTSPATIASNTGFSMTVLVDTQTSSNPAAGSTGAAPTGMVTFSATTTGSVFKPDRRYWPEPSWFLVSEVCAALACMFALLFATKRRRSAVFLGVVMVIVIAVGTSCGSSNSTSSSNTITLGTANLSAASDANGFAAGTATLNNVKLATTGTITATYSGDGNYNNSTSPAVTITVQ